MRQSPQTTRVITHIKSEYGAAPEFLWPERSPDYCIFRHGDNRNWFALIGTVSPATLGIDIDKKAEIINLKFDKGEALNFARASDHIFPAYHMNKNNWITILLDDSISDNFIFELIKKSYLLTDK